MINLRFHIVSLVAVFLALAIGIAMGATVVDQGLLSQSQRRIEAFDSTLKERAATITGLKSQLSSWERLGDEGEARMIRGRLTDTPVLVVAVQGIDEGSVRIAGERLVLAGASVPGQLWITRKARLASGTEIEDAQQVLGAASGRPETLRFLLRQRIFDALTAPQTAAPLGDLVKAGFLEFRPAAGQPKQLGAVPDGARIVVVSGPGAVVDDREFAVPLLRLFSARFPSGATAAEVGSGPLDNRDASTFVRAVLADGTLAARISTIDDLDLLAGRLALVYALEDQPSAAVGHYGVGKGADRLLPSS